MRILATRTRDRRSPARPTAGFVGRPYQAGRGRRALRTMSETKITTREQVALVEVGQTDIRRLTAAVLTAVCLALIFAVRRCRRSPSCGWAACAAVSRHPPGAPPTVAE